MLERWTAAVVRRRVAVLACWAVTLAAGSAAALDLPRLLVDSFAVPGTESARANGLLEEHFGERPDGTFAVVFEVESAGRAVRERLEQRLEDAAAAVPTGGAGDVSVAGGIAYGQIATELDLQRAKAYTDDLRAALRAQGEAPALVTGQPAVQHDLDPIFASDLRRGEAIAIPIALAVLVAVLGVSLAVVVPFLFAACTIAATLGAVWLLAHPLQMVGYTTNLVALIGLGLAVDYSLLVVSRFREELAAGGPADAAVVRTMATAGRAALSSGLAVAVGLAALLLVPVPFIRSMGVAGLLIPLASIAAALTLQPALLAVFGRRGVARLGSRRPAAHRSGGWARLARAIMRRPVPFLAAGAAAMLLLASPAVALDVAAGSLEGVPAETEAARGLELLRANAGGGAATPLHVVVDAGPGGTARSGPVRAAVARLADALFRDAEVYLVASGRRRPYVDETGRYARVVVVARHEHAAAQAEALVRRLRERLVPAARFPAGTTVAAGGAPAQGVDFLARTYGSFPWVVAVVLVLTLAVLVRAFRSLLLPVKALLLNALTVAAVYGMLVAVSQWGFGAGLLGLDSGPVEAWIPLFLFATLFGVSMDYEVFIVARMREAWDASPDNARAVAAGLERSGRVVTAAALVMVAAFSGFVAGRIPALQQFGLGLILGIVVDVTIVRALLVPSLMAVLGRWNWWLPERVARLVRVDASPLRP